MPPKTRDFLTNFGASNENVKQQESGSSSKYSPDAKCLPDTSRHNRSRSSSSRDRPPSSGELTIRTRSRSPPSKPPYNLLGLLGLGHEHLEIIRLVPWVNPRRVFELRRHVLSPDLQILKKIGLNEYEPFPTKEYIVLSTSSGGVFSIWEEEGYFVGMYNFGRRRVKVNMHNNTISAMTTGEVIDSPVGSRRIFGLNFKVTRVSLR